MGVCEHIRPIYVSSGDVYNVKTNQLIEETLVVMVVGLGDFYSVQFCIVRTYYRYVYFMKSYNLQNLIQIKKKKREKSWNTDSPMEW